ncbi:glycosyltransferase [Homoserinimonas sp. A520]
MQIVLLRLSYLVALMRRRRSESRLDWVVGPYEIASLVYDMGRALPRSLSVVLSKHRYYDLPYGWTPGPLNRLPGAARWRDLTLGPWQLGRLAAEARGFVYVGSEGFLNSGRDLREHEFRFLERRGIKIVCLFTGNDIRSPKRMRELEQELRRPNLGTYLADINPVFGTDAYDDLKRRIASVADRYADLIYNADVDQRGYLERPARPTRYFYPDDQITSSFERFEDLSRPVVVHAPSSPIIKGTQLVRAAVAALLEDGYEFEYVELIEKPNAEVKAVLGRAHIVLNEFYAFMPGVFGVEAMASGAALVTSADPDIEPQLPADSAEAWLITPPHRVLDHLRLLLDEPHRLEPLARRGAKWVHDHASASSSGSATSAELSEVLERQTKGMH